MPYQIKNGKVYGSNAVSLTQAQYDALSTAEKNNGTVYYIYDSEAVLDASDVSLGSGTVEDLAGSVAVIETSPTTATHAVGSYLVYNGQLYEVITAIAVGETLTVGTNITATSVGTELTQLNNGLNIQTVTGTDGTAVKFPDGTMIFHGFKTVALSTSAMTVHVTFPVRFNGAPSVTESTGAGGTRTEAYIEDVNDVGFNAYFNARSATSTSWLRYIAIGRWK